MSTPSSTADDWGLQQDWIDADETPQRVDDEVVALLREAIGVAPADPASRAVHNAEAAARALVGRTVASVERDLILDTLDHCLGNRTHAAKILGISIRTLRNKLNEYSSEGIAVPEPGQARVSAA